MKFKDFDYKRPNIDNVRTLINEQLKFINTGCSIEEEISAIYKCFDIFDEVGKDIEIAMIRYTLNTKDTFYESEQNFLDENLPLLTEISNHFQNEVLDSKHRDALVKEFGTYLFDKYSVSRKTFKKEIIEDLQKENKVQSKYSKLVGGAKIEFEGNTYNLAQMRPFATSINRDTRKNAQLVVSKWFEDNEEQLDDIYDDLVTIRTTIAKKLGYENFIQLGYDRLNRPDYTESDVAVYRKQILDEIVPIMLDLHERKSKRIGIKDMKSYDLPLSFLNGNPTPKGDSKWQLNHAKDMYEDMHDETGKFINMMIDGDLLDLDAKDGKVPGGYCTFIPKYDVPFIFANFNGTSGDVDVLTHEAGHAFQVYSSKNLIPDYRWPGYEGAEVHSMSMEFLAYPWIDKFFEEDTDKYKFFHVSGAINFLPYGALVDHFQHEIYRNPSMSKDDRKQTWRTLEKMYLPHKDYSEDSFLEKGTFWFRQGHIFEVPFYYIDYTLAQVVAFEYYLRSNENHTDTVEHYIKLCKLGGSKPFVSLLETMNLNNPFKEGSVKKNVTPLKVLLESIDDTKL